MRAVTTMICGMLGAALLSAPVMLPASAAMALVVAFTRPFRAMTRMALRMNVC